MYNLHSVHQNHYIFKIELKNIFNTMLYNYQIDLHTMYKYM